MGRLCRLGPLHTEPPVSLIGLLEGWNGSCEYHQTPLAHCLRQGLSSTISLSHASAISITDVEIQIREGLLGWEAYCDATNTSKLRVCRRAF